MHRIKYELNMHKDIIGSLSFKNHSWSRDCRSQERLAGLPAWSRCLSCGSRRERAWKGRCHLGFGGTSQRWAGKDPRVREVFLFGWTCQWDWTSMMWGKQGRIDSTRLRDDKNDWQIPSWIFWSKLIYIVLPGLHWRINTIRKEQMSRS